MQHRDYETAGYLRGQQAMDSKGNLTEPRDTQIITGVMGCNETMNHETEMKLGALQLGRVKKGSIGL
ncbi:hypothetical protein EYC80_002073 [Monilinia laxa]|uniref:Uncharacterized protein n=1 Tax=Monilinia laxa TaxID=61186 RepID=A0A5N6K7S1_MONLA|nr:hypothetical protein EYC80_002073 [Monilinia laxa]